MPEKNLLSNIAKTNKKLAKLGVSEITVLSRTIETNEDAETQVSTFDLSLPTATKVEGYKFLGTVERVADVYTVHSRTGEDARVHAFAKDIKTQKCDTCGKTHSLRKFFHIFDKRGETVTVGKNCAEMLFGLNFDKLQNVYKALEKTTDEINSGEGTYFAYKISDVISASLLVHDTTSEWQSHISTGNVMNQLDNAKKVEKLKMLVAKKLLKDMIKTNPVSDFQLNMYNAIALKTDEGYVLREGIIAKSFTLTAYSVFHAINGVQKRKQTEEAKQAPRLTIEQLTDTRVGQDIEIEGNVKMTMSFENNYSYYGGTTNLVKIETNDGKSYSFFSSAKFTYNLKEGDAVKIKANLEGFSDKYKSNNVKRPKLAK